MGRVDPVLQPGAVRGQRVPARVAAVANPTTALHPVRFGLAPARQREGCWESRLTLFRLIEHKSSDFIPFPSLEFGAL